MPSPKEPRAKERFEPITASVSYDREGRPVLGVRELPGRVPLTQSFEAQKAVENCAALDRQAAAPSGRRSAARQMMEEEWARHQKAIEEAQLAPPKGGPTGRHLLTSNDNPLGGGAGYVGTAAWPPYPGSQKVQSKRTYYASELPAALRPHLAVNLVPQPLQQGEEGEEGGASKRDHAAAEPVEVDPGTQTMQTRAAAAQALQVELCKEYPHGIPKYVLLRLRAEGQLLLTDLPSLQLASAASNSL